MERLRAIVSDKIANGAQGAAFLILLLMAATETEVYSFYVVCLLIAGTLILISNRERK
jgi:hypothetical protein|tara:strand:+ start:196 stop:369 length:174 start_codon:yes stop_codon:yes gene_type:complete